MDAKNKLTGFMKFLKPILLLIAVLNISSVAAQESIDVTFRYYANDAAIRAFVPGEFNDWGPNTDGRINTTATSLMEKDQENGFWYKTISLNIGGGGVTHDGKSGYVYKFHEQYNGSGSDWQWFTDPLNEIAIGQNNDSFVEITHPLIFQMQPAANQILDEDGKFWATVAAKNSDSIDVAASQFFLNDQLAGDFEDLYDRDRQLFHVSDLSAYELAVGSNELKIVAVTQSGESRVDSVEFSYLPDIEPVLESRPEGLRDGITYEENDTVSFSLFAPGKDFVFVIGDFTDWAADENFLMKKDSLKEDSVWFWLEFNELTPGQEYGFQYLIDGELRVADPYSELVLDGNNDEFIPEATFPNLKEYPSGKTSNYVSVIQPGKEDYTWEATDYVRPDKEELVIYELLLRDFLEESNYSTLIDTLDYLQNLGINAIELMPVNEFDGNLSWGYNPALHLALDKYYGAPNDFKRFVDEAHKRGIAVILDVVLNHATGQNPLYRLYGTDNPYFNATAKHTYNVFNDFNHQYAGTQYYVKRTVQYWIEEYNIDGFRWDLTKGFTQNCTASDESCTGSYQQDRVDILKKYADYQWEADPESIVIFEHLGTESEEAEWANYRLGEGKGILLWGNMNYQYNEASMGYSSNLSGILSESRPSFQARHLIGYMESHDEQWMMFKNISFGNSSGNYDITEWNTALGRQKLVGAFFYTLPGPKMIWQFGELGYGYGDNGEQCLRESPDCPTNAPGRTGQKPIRWDYLNNPDTQERVKLYKTWSALINLRRSSPAFTNPEDFDFDLSGSLKSITLQHEDSDVVVIGNFGVEANDINFTYPTTGTWYDFFKGSSEEVDSLEQTITLEAGEFKIFTTRQFETPEDGIATSNEEGFDTDTPVSFHLAQNYPNPFNPSTVINFQVPVNSRVKLEVFDMVGRKVATLVNGQVKAGYHVVNFDAGNLASGVYIYRLQAGSKILTEKMTLIK